MLAMTGTDRRDESDDDALPVRRRKSPSGLRDVKRYREIQDEKIERHEREEGHAKVTVVEPHHHLVKRVDTWWAIKALGRTKRDLPHKQWLCFVAMEFGWVEDAVGILRAHKGKQEVKERDLSFEEVAAHYGLNRSTVEEYDRTARRVYREHRDVVRAEGPEEE